MDLLTEGLRFLLRYPVLDRTGLTGKYTYQLEWHQEAMSASPPAPDTPAADPLTPTLFGVIQEQLGLRLESTKGPVEIVVIDRVERPTEN